jgi:hypothetical protein
LGSYFFTGQISDLNIWNRSLSHEEILKFSLSCDSDFVEQSNPSILLWPLANFTNIGKSTEKSTIHRKNLCQQSTDSKLKSKIVIFPKFSTSDFYSQHCKNLNGEPIYPQNDKDIQYLIDSVGSLLVNNECSGKFWVPFVRSGTIGRSWIYESKKHPGEEHSFSVWMKASLNDTHIQNQCMYFDTTTKQFNSIECSSSEYSNYFCSLCAIDESRFIFNLHIDCATSLREVIANYFLVPQNLGYYFLGVSGLTKIEPTGVEMSDWQITIVGESSSLLANMVGNEPFGIKTWSHKFGECKENSSVRMKLNNVSCHLITQNVLSTPPYIFLYKSPKSYI